MQDGKTNTTTEAPLIEIRRATVYRGSTRVFEDLDRGLTARRGAQCEQCGQRQSCAHQPNRSTSIL